MLRHVVDSRFHALLVTAVAGAVLLTNLGGPALWDDDEPKNAACSRAMLAANDWVVPTFNGRLRVEKPPLVNWVQIAGYAAFGDNETGARIGSALLTVGTCLLTWRIGCLLLGPATGLLGGLAMASCIWTAVGGRAATPDAPLVFCTTLALFFFVADRMRCGAAVDRRPLSLQAAVGIGAACGAAVLAKGPVGFVLPLAAFVMFACWRKAALPTITWRAAIESLRLPIIAATAAAVAMPWYAWVTLRTDGAWLEGFLLVHNVGRFAAPMEGHSGSFFYYPVVVAIGLFPWSIVLAAMIAHSIGILRSPAADNRRMPAQLLACWSIAWIGAFSCSGTKLPGYIWPSYPALAILTGMFLDGWARGETSGVRWCRDPARAIGVVMRLAWSVLAAAGVAMAIALPVLASRHCPGCEWLGILGLIPVAAAAAAWHWQSAGRPVSSLAAVAACSCLLVTALAAVAATELSRAQGVRALAVDEPLQHCSWACFWNVPPSLVFYTHARVGKLDTPEDVVRHLTRSQNPRVVIDSRHEHLVSAAIPPGFGVLARIPILADHHYVVIGPETAPEGSVAIR
jgi:4-amino-4-deoxy-L-arabinose transferase-like glycosyltransferase